MDWIKIPTDSILYSEFKDSELIALIKYQALYCQLETEPTDAQLRRVLNQKQLKFVQSYSQVVQELCKSQVEKIKRKRNNEKENYKQKQQVVKNSVYGKLSERERTIEADKIREDKNIITPLDNKLSIPPTRGKVKKISFSDVLDWESLFTYWEENKKGGRYKNEESRQRMLGKLKELTGNDFSLAKLSICHAIDNKYQGFCNGSELFYKPPKGALPEFAEDRAKRQQEEQERLNRIFGEN